MGKEKAMSDADFLTSARQEPVDAEGLVALQGAIVRQAFADLFGEEFQGICTIGPAVHANRSRRFFFDKRGPWFDMLEEICPAANLDPGAVRDEAKLRSSILGKSLDQASPLLWDLCGEWFEEKRKRAA